MAIWEFLLYSAAFFVALMALVKMMRMKHSKKVEDLRNHLRYAKHKLMEQMQTEEGKNDALAGAQPDLQTALDLDLQKELQRQQQEENRKNSSTVSSKTNEAA